MSNLNKKALDRNMHLYYTSEASSTFKFVVLCVCSFSVLLPCSNSVEMTPRAAFLHLSLLQQGNGI